MDQAEWKLLKEIAELEKTPQGAYNIRRNGALDSRNSTANIEITTKTEPGKSGIDIRIKPGTRHESVHIPVIISQTGLSEMVYNDFFIGEDCDVDIVAGCGIHNTGCETSQHDGVHTFYVGKNSKVRYVERHYGEGPGTGKRIMNPQTVVYLEEGATINLESTQIRGVDSTKRETKIVVGKDAEAIITEKLLTHGEQTAESDMEIILDGEGANGRVVPLGGPGPVPAGVLPQGDGQRQVLRPCAVRLHHHGRRQNFLHPRHRGQPCGRPAHSRGGHRTHRRRPDSQAHDPGPHRAGGGGEDSRWIPTVSFWSW